MKWNTHFEWTYGTFQLFILLGICSMVLSACELLPKARPAASIQMPNSPITQPGERARDQALGLLSPLALRVGVDRYQAELFGDALPGSPEDDRRTHWIEAEFQRAGLIPAGDASSRWQHSIGLTGYQSLGTVAALSKGSAKSQTLDEGMKVWSLTPLQEIRLERNDVIFLPLIPSSQNNLADGKKDQPKVLTDLRGKIVLIKEDRNRSAVQQFAWGAHQGVAGLILIHDPKESDLRWKDILDYAQQEHFTLTAPNGNSDTPLIMGWATQDQVQKWLALTRTEKEGNVNRFSLIPINFRISIHNTWKNYDATQVVGRIPGETADSASNAVVFRSCMSDIGIASLIAAAQGLSQPGEIAQRDMIFIAPSPAEKCNSVWNTRPLGVRPDSNQTVLVFDPPTVLKETEQDSDQLWGRRSQTSQNLLNLGYQAAGPWAHR